jgi:beta-glucosidase
MIDMPRRNRHPFILVVLTLAASCLAFGQKEATAPAVAPKYRDPHLSIDERVADLLSRMTLEEKVAEICGGDDPHLSLLDSTGAYRPDQVNLAFRDLYDEGSQFTPRQAAILRNAVQRYLREKTPLGIPWLFMSEALHGFMSNGSTSFPQALALASRRRAGFQSGARHRPRSALGPHRGNLWRRPVPGVAHRRGRHHRTAGRSFPNR